MKKLGISTRVIRCHLGGKDLAKDETKMSSVERRHMSLER